MRRRRKTGDPVLRAPESFGLAQLHLLRAEAFFQLVSSPKDNAQLRNSGKMIELHTAFLREFKRPANTFKTLVTTIEVHHFFSEVHQFGGLRPRPKPDLEKNKDCCRMKKSHGLGTQRELCENKWRFFSDDFGLRSPGIQKIFRTKIVTSIVACVLSEKIIVHAI